MFHESEGFEFKFNYYDKLVRDKYTVTGTIGQKTPGEYEICTRRPCEFGGCHPDKKKPETLPRKGLEHMAHVQEHDLKPHTTNQTHGYCPICDERYCITCFYTPPPNASKKTTKAKKSKK